MSDDSIDTVKDIYKKLQEKERQIDLEIQRLESAVENRNVVMNKLHEYNDIKDATQVVIGALANIQQVTVRKLHEQFELNDSD